MKAILPSCLPAFHVPIHSSIHPAVPIFLFVSSRKHSPLGLSLSFSHSGLVTKDAPSYTACVISTVVQAEDQRSAGNSQTRLPKWLNSDVFKMTLSS